MKKLLAVGSLLAALVVLTPGTAPAAAPPDHYATHPIKVRPHVSSSPSGLLRRDILNAYKYSDDLTAGTGKTIAIVDAYDNPNALADLNVFNEAMGLPPCNSTDCFQKVDQRGGTKYPRVDPGWALEIALDIQWAHAMAPGAKILLVEAATPSFTNLLAAEDYAKTHAEYVSNSWGAAEFSGESSYDSHFAQPGVSFFVSAGDAGLPAEYPSSSPNVISVGGTRLTQNSSSPTGWDETGWSEGGGGCSLYESATSAQASFGEYGRVKCGTKRATPDVSLNADPASGVSVYMSTKYQGRSGWFTVGGTSASAPMVAGRAAAAKVFVDSAYVYGRATGFFRDITSGFNGASCLTGFDLCTGRGSWLGSIG
jgi:subtilase family serine protease